MYYNSALISDLSDHLLFSDGPATVENIQQACLTSTEQLSIIN